jgi:hypothetical protein
VRARVRYRRTCRIRSERLHGGADLRPLDVAEDLVPVLDRLEVVERRVEEGAELVLVAAGDDGRDYLVEVEVREERRLVAELVLAVREEDALERPRPGGSGCGCSDWTWERESVDMASTGGAR